MGSHRQYKVRVMAIGRMHSGKDSLWSIMNGICPDIKRIAQADILKDVCSDTMKVAYEVMGKYGIAPDWYDFENMMSEKQYMRRMYIDFGTGIMRNNVKDTIWLDACVEKNIETIVNGQYVNTDIRFMDEWAKFAELGAITVRIVCDKEVLWARYLANNPKASRDDWEEFYAGETETLVDELADKTGHYTITNNGTLDQFQIQVAGLLANIQSGYRG